jgi:hypothetical protein
MNLVGFKDKVLFDGGSQSLVFEAPQGRPDADGTVTLYDTRFDRTDSERNPIGGTPMAATRKAIDGVLTGASGASLANPARVTCTPPSAMAVGDMVILRNAAGQSERKQVTAKAGAYFDVDSALVFDYATSDTFKSAVMTSSAVDLDWIADETNLGEDFIAEWTYDVDGVSYVARTRFDLVREAPAAQVHDSTLFERFPDLRRFTFQAHPDTYAPLSRAAQRDTEGELILGGYDPDKVRNTGLWNWMVEVRTHLLIAENGLKPGGRDVEQYVEARRAEWERVVNAITRGTLKMPYDKNEDDVISSDDRKAQPLGLIR